MTQAVVGGPAAAVPPIRAPTASRRGRRSHRRLWTRGRRARHGLRRRRRRRSGRRSRRSWWARNAPSRAVLTGTMTAPSRPRASHSRTKSRPLGSEHRHGVAAPHSEGRESGRHLTRVAGGGGIRQRALADDVHELRDRPASSAAARARAAAPSGSRRHRPCLPDNHSRAADPVCRGRHRVRRDVAARPTPGPDTRASVSRMSLRDDLRHRRPRHRLGPHPFGRLDDESLEGLVVSAASEALECAGVEPGQVDEIVLGTFNSGMWPLGFASSLALQVSDELANVPATRVENACASGSAAVQQGVKSLLAGTARTVLVIGAEKMTHAPADVVGAALLGADYELAGKPSTTGFAGLFADVARHYEKRHGPVGDILGSIAAKNHRNGVAQPLRPAAQGPRRGLLPDGLGPEPGRRRPAAPHRLLARVRRRRGPRALDAPAPAGAADPVRLAGFGHANDFLPAPKRDPLAFAGTTAAWQRALRHGRASTLADLDLVELHDCFTIAELVDLRGDRARAARRGAPAPRGRQRAPRRPAAGQRLRRAQGQGPPRRRHRRLAARAGGDAARPARPVTCSCRRRGALRCTTWAASPSPTT